jgi:hypothetical protein
MEACGAALAVGAVIRLERSRAFTSAEDGTEFISLGKPARTSVAVSFL